MTDQTPASKAGRVAVVIPARGGSKGIPGKFRPIGGVPLVGRTVRAAKAAASVDRVLVSSDDAEILRVAEAHGAEGLLRPADISGDTASSEASLLHAISTLEAQGDGPDILVFLQCTSPFTEARHIDDLVAAIRNGAAAALTVSPNHGFLWRAGADGMGVGVNHDHTKPRARRQDLPPEYRENGAGYAMRVDAFKAAKTRFCGPTALVMTDLPIIELDEPEDISIAEATLRARAQPVDPARIKAIRVLVTDFDGVHTDDFVYMAEDGRETVRCSRADGLGVSMLREAGVDLLILSREQNPVVSRRADKLKAPVIQGVGEKAVVLADWVKQRGLDFSQVAYLGNDKNDLSCMARAGLSMAPADAHSSALESAHIVLAARGGEGAVREACELLLKWR